jgi:hypothetical protein
MLTTKVVAIRNPSEDFMDIQVNVTIGLTADLQDALLRFTASAPPFNKIRTTYVPAEAEIAHPPQEVPKPRGRPPKAEVKAAAELPVEEPPHETKAADDEPATPAAFDAAVKALLAHNPNSGAKDLKGIISEFKTDSGETVGRLGQLQPKDRQAVIEAINAKIG